MCCCRRAMRAARSTSRPPRPISSSTANGKIEQILPRTRNDAHRLIEECMLAANVCAADLLERHKHPTLFRIHASPSKEKLNQLRTFLKQMGLNLGGGDVAQRVRLCRAAAKDQAASRRAAAADHAAALDAAGGLQPGKHRPFRPVLRGLCPLHQPDPALSRPADASRDQGHPAGKRYDPRGIEVSELNTSLSPAARKQAADKAAARRSWKAI
jgi:ribonuclease R